MKRVITVFLCLIMILSLVACKQKNSDNNQKEDYDDREVILDNDLTDEQKNSTLALKDNSAKVYIDSYDAENFLGYLDKITIDYPYSDLFETEECYNRLNITIDVKNHKFSALNSKQELDVNYLADIVLKNNKEYLSNIKNNTFGLEIPEDSYLKEVCGLIVDTVNKLKKEHSNINYNRVYCNLGNLKIMYKKGMIQNAQVNEKIVLTISPNMLKIVENTYGENASRNVIIHEIMHIVQLGCDCEQINNCGRRCGISYMWNDFKVNTSDFSWLSEGSAERSMCNLTGDSPITYENMINYLTTLNLCSVADKKITANYAETICFYDDINILYNMFGAETVEDKYEILNMMIAINIILSEPDDILNLIKDDKDKVSLMLKPKVATAFTKYFYKNLTLLLSSETNVTTNDICYLISLFEVNLDNLLRFSNGNNAYNDDFIVMYKSLRSKFFSKIKNVDNLTDLYNNYSVFCDSNEKTVNASLKWNTKEKNIFLLERTDYLAYRIDFKIN